MDEQQLHDDLVTISAWVDPVVAPDTDHLDALTLNDRPAEPSRSGVPWQRTLLAAAAVVMVLVGVWVLTGRNHDDGQTVSPTPATGGSTDPGVNAADWVEVAKAPLQPRAEAQVRWTGKEFVVFAGSDQAPCPLCDYATYGQTRHDAAAYDPATNTWRSIADLPDVSSYIGTSAVVDGDVYWMSVRNPNTTANGIDATLQKWSSTDDTWTEVPLPAEVPGNPQLMDFDGRLLLYPGTDEVGAFPDQVLLGTEWSSLPDDPLGVTTGRQFLMLNGTLTLFATEEQRVVPSPTPALVIGASYDGASATWTRLPDSDQLTAPVVALDGTAYAPLGGGADGGEVNNWGRTVPNGGSYSAADGWLAFVPPVPDDLMGVVSADGSAVLGVKGHVLQVADGTYQAIPALPDGIGDQYGQAIANGDGMVFTFGGGYSDANGGLGVHNRGFLWRPGTVVDAPVTPVTDPSGSGQSALDAAITALGIDAATAPAGAFDLEAGVFCGYETVSFGNDNGVDLDGRNCFAAAIADGTTAMFISQMMTTEGDPVAYVWHAGANGGHEYIDSTRDHFGSGGWTATTCESVVGAANYPAFTCIAAPGAPATEAPSPPTKFCDGAVKLLQSPDLGAVVQLIADLRGVDTTQLTQAQQGAYVQGIAALENNVGSPNGYDTQVVTAAVNDICNTSLSAYYATP